MRIDGSRTRHLWMLNTMLPFLAPLLAVHSADATVAAEAQPVRTILRTPLDTLPPLASAPAPEPVDTPLDTVPETPLRRPPAPTRRDTADVRAGIRPWTVRFGLHGSREDIGLAAGCGLLSGYFAAGMDIWVRPGVFIREVQTSPGRRAQYKEVLFGSTPWIAIDIPIAPEDGPDRPFRIAAVGALDISGGTWYGTTKSPGSETVVSVGGRATLPLGLQFELRRGFQEGMLGRWRGELAWEF